MNALWLILPITLILALGKHTPIYQWLYDALPPFRMFRVPARWFEIWYFAACVLAAFGLDAYLKLSTARARQVLAGVITLLLLTVVVAIAVGALPSTSSLWLETAQWNKTGDEIGRAQSLQIAAYLRSVALQSVLGAVALLMLGCYLLRRLQTADAARRNLWAKLLLGLIFFDVLIVFWSTVLSADDLPPRNPWPRGIANYYRSGDRWNTALEGAAFSYGLNRGLPHNIDILGGYDTLIPEDFFAFAAAVEGREFWSSQYQAQKNDPLLQVAGITHLFGMAESPRIPEFSANGAKLVAQFGQGENATQLWKLPAAWPRVFLATRVLRAPRARQLALLREAAARSTPLVVADEAAFPDLPARDFPAGRVLHWRRPANKTIIEVETFAPQILVHSETLSPGWRAWVNGKSAKIERANFLFRGVEVPRGKSRVVFVYDNQTLRFGIFLTLLGLSAAAGALSFAAGNRRARRAAAATSN